MANQIIKFLGDDERNEELEKALLKPMVIGEPEHLKKDKSPEEKKYLLLYYANDENGNEIKSFELITGRTATYDFIKNIIESLDIHESKVIVETVTLNEMVSVYEFMKHISSIIDDKFDIEEYNVGDINEYDED